MRVILIAGLGLLLASCAVAPPRPPLIASAATAPAAEIDAEVLARFDAEGLAIAQATRAHLGTGRRVYYAPEAQYHGVVTAKWIET
jgi:hypothetical protein